MEVTIALNEIEFIISTVVGPVFIISYFILKAHFGKDVKEGP